MSMNTSSRDARGAVRAGPLLGLGLVAAAAIAAALIWAGRSAPRAAVLSVVPADATTLVWVPRTVELLEGVRTFAGRLGMGPRLQALEADLFRQLGFNPGDVEALKERGLDPEGGLAVFTLGTSRTPVVALAVTDGERFEAAMRELLVARAGARPGEPVQIGEAVVETLQTADGRLVAAWAQRDSVMVLSASSGAPERVAAALAAGSGASVVDGAWFARAREEVGPSPALFAYASEAGVRQLAPKARPVPAVAFALSAGPSGLEVRAFLGLAPEQQGVLAPFRKTADARSLVQEIDPRALLAARTSLDPVAAWSWLRKEGLPRRLEELESQLTARGVALEEELLPLLEGTIVLDLGIAPSPDLTNLSGLDPRRTNPFEYLRVAALVPIRDRRKAEALLPALAEALAPALRARIEAVEVAGRKAWTVRYNLGEGMTFGLVGDVVVVGGGSGAFTDAVARLTTEVPPLVGTFGNPEVLRSLASEGAAAAALDVAGVLETVRTLPSAAYGSGPDAIVMRSLVNRTASLASEIQRVGASAGPVTDGVAARLELVLRAPPEAAAE